MRGRSKSFGADRGGARAGRRGLRPRGRRGTGINFEQSTAQARPSTSTSRQARRGRSPSSKARRGLRPRGRRGTAFNFEQSTAFGAARASTRPRGCRGPRPQACSHFELEIDAAAEASNSHLSREESGCVGHLGVASPTPRKSAELGAKKAILRVNFRPR